MKKAIFVSVLVLLFSASIPAENFQVKYVGEIITKDTGIPMAIAADSKGGIYYTVINYGKENSTGSFLYRKPVGVSSG